MTYNAEQLKADLDTLTTKSIGPRPNYDEIEVNPPSFIANGILHVDGEREHGVCWLDYYGEFRGGGMWINPELEQWATKHGGFWEWKDPGSISFHI